MFFLQESANEEVLPTLIAKEKVTFILNARNLSSVSLAKLKWQYSEQDARAISEEVCIAFDECIILGQFPLNVW